VHHTFVDSPPDEDRLGLIPQLRHREAQTWETEHN